MTAFRQTLKTAEDIADAGLISNERAAETAAVAGRYAVSVTPAMAALIDATDEPLSDAEYKRLSGLLKRLREKGDSR